MPANLNALIRYKTINSCLFGGTRKYDIQELIDACSEALTEARGRTTKISERTIRDDIRVMRSDILGFNAPIVQKDSLYFYSDPKYTLLAVGITDSGILEMIVKSLLRISTDVKHPELEIILQKLRGLTPWSFETEKIEYKTLNKLAKAEISDSDADSFKLLSKHKKYDSDLAESNVMMPYSLKESIPVTWGEVFGLLKY